MMTGRKLCTFLKIPLVTSCCVVLCTTLFLIDFKKQIGWKHKHLCLNSHEIIRSGQVYRIFTHTFLHKGPWHLAVTMIPMLFLGSLIEKHIGSILFFLFVMICWLISTMLEVAMTTMLYHVFHNLFHGCSLGFSGIVIGLIAALTKAVNRKQCGLYAFQVPLSFLPWIFLVLYYFGFHRGAVFLHLGGIIAGYAYSFDVFNCCLPSPERLAEWENSDRWKCLVELPCFIRFAQITSSTHTKTAVRREHIFGRSIPLNTSADEEYV